MFGVSAASAILALSLLAGTASLRPAAPHVSRPACVEPTRTGTFRLITMKADSSSARPAMLVLENLDGCLEATFVTDDRGPAAISRLEVSGDTLRGAVRMPSGDAPVQLRFTQTTVAGSIMEGKQEWMLTGRRTS